MEYPLDMRFKILAIAPQISVVDAQGAPVCYVQQKLFRLKEVVTVFSDSSKKQKLCEIKADRMLDWSASYHFYDANGECFGGVRRKGMKSLWSAHYDVVDENNQPIGSIGEENPMAKVLDSLLSEVPFLGALSGYFFNPRYLMTSAAGQEMLRLRKQPAMLEGKFLLLKLAPIDPVHELCCIMAFLMMTLLERSRG